MFRVREFISEVKKVYDRSESESSDDFKSKPRSTTDVCFLIFLSLFLTVLVRSRHRRRDFTNIHFSSFCWVTASSTVTSSASLTATTTAEMCAGGETRSIRR
jgi:hypothetical protein